MKYVLHHAKVMRPIVTPKARVNDEKLLRMVKFKQVKVLVTQRSISLHAVSVAICSVVSH